MRDSEIRDIEIRDEMIRLGQLLKLAGIAEDGVHAKDLLDADEVTVNGTIEFRRGRQLHDGDVIQVGNEQVRVVARP
ncbi:ribosome-associated protein [Labedaea rhizosphaerae]|uniref:Ribosome-associated protein n=2 Tax=Labedaea rhizosphaerae TaxID=598644 RepID=A0A4R6SFB3_LABRH|nr:ribosome-associated protein [Labedaea rhizosphaerae]